MAEDNILSFDTVSLDEKEKALVIINQTVLPNKVELLKLTKQAEIHKAIYLLQVRGAPAIGVAAAYGIYLAAEEVMTDSYEDFLAAFRKAEEYLNSARPTAVNLSWALKRMEKVVLKNSGITVNEIKKCLLQEAHRIKSEDIETCRKIGEYGLSLLRPGDGLLTHCNAGRLATIKYGTATAPMYLGHEKGYDFHIFCDETRPLLQGARLTAFELQQAGMDVTLICDGMAASVMKKGKVQAVFTGCDRVAANGDAANKIGTMPLAIAAKHFNVPFYICAPTSTIDMASATGDDIKIEERSAQEVTEMWYADRMAPQGIKVFNPSFDVTDAGLITAIITERGIIRPPFKNNLAELMKPDNYGEK